MNVTAFFSPLVLTPSSYASIWIKTACGATNALGSALGLVGCGYFIGIGIKLAGV